MAKFFSEKFQRCDSWLQCPMKKVDGPPKFYNFFWNFFKIDKVGKKKKINFAQTIFKGLS